jgi:hypothetical protein
LEVAHASHLRRRLLEPPKTEFRISNFEGPHNGRERRCVINGYTGKVKGERPVSAAKIWLTVLAVLAIIAALVAIPTYFLH